MINRKEDTVMLVLQSRTTAVPSLPASIKTPIIQYSQGLQVGPAAHSGIIQVSRLSVTYWILTFFHKAWKKPKKLCSCFQLGIYIGHLYLGSPSIKFKLKISSLYCCPFKVVSFKKLFFQETYNNYIISSSIFTK